MKKFAIILAIMLMIEVNALEISEVELNPVGKDNNQEWIELFSSEEISLSGYSLFNQDDEEIALTGKISGYWIKEIEGQWLDNSEERVFLKKNNQIISETPILKDDKNNDYTWQNCGKWTQKNSTKGEENCKKIIETTEQEENIVIKLATQNIKTPSNKNERSKYALIGLIGFCILLLVLYLIKNSKQKTEFE